METMLLCRRCQYVVYCTLDCVTSDKRSRMLLKWKASWRQARRLVRTSVRTLSTYYDSQSGMHVSVHKDNEVTAYCSWTASEWNQLELETLAKRGIGGVLVRTWPSHSPDAAETIHSWSRAFRVFLPWTLLPPEPTVLLKEEWANRNVTFVFPNDNQQQIAATMAQCVDRSISTALQCGQDDQQGDPVMAANQVAQLLDDTGAGNFVLVAGNNNNNNNNNNTVPLCEELCYLDLVGPTMKSRLVVQVNNNDNDNDNADADETVEECLRMGINKFVVSEDQLSWLGQLVLAEGKSCTFQF
jgi:hypothetical protein